MWCFSFPSFVLYFVLVFSARSFHFLIVKARMDNSSLLHVFVTTKVQFTSRFIFCFCANVSNLQ